MPYSVITAPESEPVTLADAKLYLREDGTEQDDVISALITAAREHAENFTGRAFSERKLRVYFNEFDNNGMRLPFPPLKTVDAVKYLDTAGVEQTLDSSEYTTVAGADPGVLIPAYGKSFPATLAVDGAVRVEITCGDVPQAVKTWILLKVNHLFQHRGDEEVKWPEHLDAMLWPYKVITF